MVSQDSKIVGLNPYEAPRSDCPAPTHEPVLSNWSGRIPVVVTSLCYGAFTLFLLNSGGMDRKAGFMFLMNVPVFVVWSLLEWRGNRMSSLFGCVTVGVQVLITTMMLLTGIGDAGIVVAINGGITLGLLLVAGISWRCQMMRRHAVAQSP